jgi:hypothetical protein
VQDIDKIKRMYKNTKNTIVLSPVLAMDFHKKYDSHLEHESQGWGGYSMSKYKLKGVYIETSIWINNDIGYYFDKLGNIHVLSFKDGKFTVAHTRFIA